jgi:hypothetical protein
MIAIQSKLEDELDLVLFAFEQYQISRYVQDQMAACSGVLLERLHPDW